MFNGSRRRSIQTRLKSPFGWAAIHGRNWSELPPSSLTFTGADQLFPPLRAVVSRTSAFVQDGSNPPRLTQEPLGKSVQATEIVPSGATAAVGKLWARRP